MAGACHVNSLQIGGTPEPDGIRPSDVFMMGDSLF
jgi:hypothetical protein